MKSQKKARLVIQLCWIGLKQVCRKLWQKRKVRIGTFSVIAILIVYKAFVGHVEPGRVGVARNIVSGEIRLQHPGWHITPPWMFSTRVDTRPIRVSVDSSGRGYGAKLIQFDLEHWKEFVDTEGWRFYWWSNRFSFNWGYKEEHRGIRDILRGYAYGSKSYPFIKVLEERIER